MKCIKSGCDRQAVKNSNYCELHQPESPYRRKKATKKKATKKKAVKKKTTKKK